MKALLNHPMGEMVSEKDRPILGYLQNIELELHDEEKGEGFDLIFTFAQQTYFEPSVLKKEIHMKHKGLVDKMVSTEIKWKDGCDPTRKKVKKKRKGKKVTVEVKCDSFFNFFKDEPEKSDKDEEKDEDGADMDVDELQDEHQQLAEQFKDDLVPLALEYYLGVIEQDDEDGFDDEDEDVDSDEDKKKGKKGKKGGKGDDGKECK